MKNSKEIVHLRKVDPRRKSEKYACTSCGGVCYYDHSKKPIDYKFCPNCGKEITNDD